MTGCQLGSLGNWREPFGEMVTQEEEDMGGGGYGRRRIWEEEDMGGRGSAPIYRPEMPGILARIHDEKNSQHLLLGICRRIRHSEQDPEIC